MYLERRAKMDPSIQNKDVTFEAISILFKEDQDKLLIKDYKNKFELD